MLDGHVHIMSALPCDAALERKMRSAGVDGAVVMSLPPASFPCADCPTDAATRLANLMQWCRGGAGLIPAYWIDPTEDDAEAQVEQAIAAGAAAFKVMCNHFYPSDKRAMRTYAQIAVAGKAVLFHSGILWDGCDSSRFNRPAEFECMLDVPDLRFSLAHISWPWCDECLAVYGKLQQGYKSRKRPMSMYIDTTPGTPVIYRKDALTKLFTIGYDVRQNVFFGSDNFATDYNDQWVRDWAKRDRAILAELSVPEEDVALVFEVNLRRFLFGN